MNILFIHGNFPGQFHWLAEQLGRQGQHDVRFLTARAEAAQQQMPGVRVELYSEPEEGTASASLLHHASDQAITRAAVIETRLVELAQAGFVPRLVVVHGGNGLALLIKTLIPDCCVIGYFEWYFQPDSAGVLLGQEDRLSRSQVQLRNLVISQELLHCDRAVVPTAWQASQFPAPLRRQLTVIFDGVERQLFQPPADQARGWPLQLQGEAGGLQLQQGQQLLSYATRGMEPLRGFPEFLRALPVVLEAEPELQVLIAGRDRSAYGMPAPSHGGSWKQRLLDELGDFAGRERLHWCGLLPRGNYRQLLQRTNLHCYFSRPYVTSWSLFEAVACAAPLLTNPGDTTTGVLPGVVLQQVELEAGPKALAAAMVSGLRHSQPTGVPPEWLWREQSQQQWQALINGALKGEAIVQA